MAFIRKILAELFSTEFLLKILIISAIFAVLKFVDSGIRITIYHYINNPYGGFEIVFKDKR